MGNRRATVAAKRQPRSVVLLRFDQRPVPKKVFSQPTLTLARDLLGRILVSRIGGTYSAGIIVETEAYHGEVDQACHSYRGRKNGGRSDRTEVMFKGAGHLYVYFIYGVHYCCNVVSEEAGVGAAVLIRAIVPIEGLTTMRSRRGGASIKALTNGPGKVCQALGITGRENGLDLTHSARVQILRGVKVPPRAIQQTRRIGISKSKDLPWRFVVRDPESLLPSCTHHGR